MNSQNNSPKLNVFWEESIVGQIWSDDNVALQFQYDSEWVKSGFPISLSLPFNDGVYGQVAHNFFANLLPEGDYRQKVERLFKVSSGNDYSLLAAIGGDCAGALSIEGEPQASQEAFYEEPSPQKLLQIIQTEGVSGLDSRGAQSRLSLAGAQGKLPILFDDQKIQIPKDGAPSTHILKFNRFHGQFPKLIENEYFMTQVAHRLGMKTINCRLLNLEGTFVFMSERYDRMMEDRNWPIRLHQEDFCQAMGLSYLTKYEKEGGPSLANCVALVRRHLSLLDVEQVVRWTLFNLILGNSDAHGKNISILYDAAKRIRLAPFYDLVCTRAYEGIDRNLAMAIGGRFDPDIIGSEQLKHLANDIQITAPYLKGQLKAMFEGFPAAITYGKECLEAAGVSKNQMEHVYVTIDKLVKRFQRQLLN